MPPLAMVTDALDAKLFPTVSVRLTATVTVLAFKTVVGGGMYTQRMPAAVPADVRFARSVVFAENKPAELASFQAPPRARTGKPQLYTFPAFLALV